MTSNDLAEMHKRMEWQKAKGHLCAMLETYHSEGDPDELLLFDDMRKTVEAFVKEIEDRL